MVANMRSRGGVGTSEQSERKPCPVRPCCGTSVGSGKCGGKSVRGGPVGSAQGISGDQRRFGGSAPRYGRQSLKRFTGTQRLKNMTAFFGFDCEISFVVLVGFEHVGDPL